MDGQQHMGIRPPGKALSACPLFLRHSCFFFFSFLLRLSPFLLWELHLTPPEELACSDAFVKIKFHLDGEGT